jgi:pimeloyl-ACP methyl ester carboxylesterase
MAMATIEGIPTYFETYGSGPPLLMCAPGGFDADIEKWRTQGVYSHIKFLEHLPQRFTCIAYDRRDTGRSGGRVDRITWLDYARHAKGMLEHLDLDRAHIMGGCMGCSVAIAFGTAYPHLASSLVLFWPVGGAKYRINGHLRFADHLAFVHQNGLAATVELARQSGKSFGNDSRVGPWVSVIRNDPEFASRYAVQNLEDYKLVAGAMANGLLDRDTSPGAEPEDLMRLSIPTLVVPGSDASHATSAARYLHECIPNSEYWDVPTSAQAGPQTNAKVIGFLQGIA